MPDLAQPVAQSGPKRRKRRTALKLTPVVRSMLVSELADLFEIGCSPEEARSVLVGELGVTRRQSKTLVELAAEGFRARCRERARNVIGEARTLRALARLCKSIGLSSEAA